MSSIAKRIEPIGAPDPDGDGARRPQTTGERLDAMLKATDPKWHRAFAEVARRYPKKKQAP